MTESNKNNSRNKTGSIEGKIVPTAAGLDKKPIRVRKKSRALQNDNPQVSKWQGDKELKIKSAQTQNSKRKTPLVCRGSVKETFGRLQKKNTLSVLRLNQQKN